MIRIVGLGPGAKEALTIGTLDVLKNTKKLFLRTEKHPTVEFIRELGIEFMTYDNNYDNSQSFEEVYRSIAEDLLLKHQEHMDITYAVPGHPLVAEKSVIILLDLCKERGIETELIPAVSFFDAIMESMHIDPVEGVKIVDAFEIHKQVLDKRVHTIITQVYNQFIASEVKLALSEYYKDDTEIFFIRAAGVKGLETIRKMALHDLDRQDDVDHLTSIFIPKQIENTKDFQDLLEIMEALRGEDGCPWDKEQNHKSLKRYLVEESYEVLEAIDEEDEDMLVEELGDVLLQVIFHAQIGKEEGYFDILDVIEGICTKMIRRHPHIFGEVKVKNSGEVLQNWDEIKKKEKKLESYTEELKHIAKNLPALMRAEKVQAKAARVGFDWNTVEPALDKVLEELNEVKDVYKGNNRAKIVEEMGDLIFATVNVARFLDIDPENALNYTIDKFIKRFQYIEEAANQQGMKLEEMTLQQMDEFWNESKKQ